MTTTGQDNSTSSGGLAVVHILNFVGMLGMIVVLVSAYTYQFTEQSLPCTLCLLQRIAMLGVAFGAAMNLMLGPRPRHYAVCIVSAVFGLLVAMRQTLLHINPYWDQSTNMPTLDANANPPFGSPVLGLSLYTWGIVIFTVAILLAGIMLLADGQFRPVTEPPMWMVRVAQIGVWILLVVAALETVSTFAECGPFDCPNDGGWDWWLFNR
jgi:disulfide bond formation protein DsbB